MTSLDRPTRFIASVDGQNSRGSFQLESSVVMRTPCLSVTMTTVGDQKCAFEWLRVSRGDWNTPIRPTLSQLCPWVKILNILSSWRSACSRTEPLAAPAPAACRQREAALGDWRGSARLTGTTTGAAGRLPTSAC